MRQPTFPLAHCAAPTRRRALQLGLAFCAVPHASVARANRYQLDPALSQVGFRVGFGPDVITGDFPIAEAEALIDFDDLPKTQLKVTLNAAKARASFPFAAQALRSVKVLDTDNFPDITFTAHSVTPDHSRPGVAAQIEGQVVLRGITRPMTLAAEIFKQAGHTQIGDYDALSVQLRGHVLRSDFGAIGWADMVADRVDLDILARISRVV